MVLAFAPLRAKAGDNVSKNYVEDIERPLFTGVLSEKYMSRDVRSSGSIKSEGPVIQDLLKINFGKLSPFIWANHDLTATNGPSKLRPNEVDFGVDYNMPISSNLSFRATAAYFNYPKKILSPSNDKVVEGNLSYSGKINANVIGTHYMQTDSYPAIDRVVFSVAKPFDIGKIKNWKLNIAPGLRTAYVDNHQGTKGIAYWAYTTSVGASHNNISLETSVQCQDGNEDNKRENINFLTFGGKIKF